jgi:3-methyladenine DNA glycosylase AlkC
MNEEKALKNLINKNVVRKMAGLISSFYSSFNTHKFIKQASQLEDLELKDRVGHVSKALKLELTHHFKSDALILRKVLETHELKGFELWPISEYISENGLDHFEEAFDLMYLLTQDFTSEFAIRPFLKKDFNRCLKKLSKWIEDENVHIRRWVSEGTRPILPWGGKIQAFIENPITLNLIEKLKYDEELYVRKSVANHLNDISKSHPQLVVETLKRWEAKAPKTHVEKIRWIKKHSLRTLIKNGHPEALALMGASKQVDCKISKLVLNKKTYQLGDDIIFSFDVISTSRKSQNLIVDYGIRFCKSGGKSSIKIFKLKVLNILPGETKSFRKTHSLRKITTMKFYSGMHELILQINGSTHEKVSWYFNC